MTALWNLLRKDTGLARPWIAIFWAFGGLACAQRLLWPRPGYAAVPYLQFADWLALAVGAMAAARLVQEDFFRDPRGFLRTRPVAEPRIIASKSLTLALWFVIPAGLFQCACYLALGFSLSPADLGLAFLDRSLTVAAVLFVAVLPALLVRQLAYVLLGAVGGVIVLSVVAVSIFRPSAVVLFSDDFTAQQLQLSRGIVVQFVAVAGAPLVAWLYARTRSGPPALLAAGVTIALALAAWWTWPFNFTALLSDHARPAPRAEWPDQVRWTWEKSGHDDSFLTFALASTDRREYQTATGWCRPAHLPPPWYAAPRAVRSRLTFGAGPAFPYRTDLARPVDPSPLFAQWQAQASADRTLLFTAELGRYWSAAIPAGAARLTGELQVDLLRPAILASLPLRRGASCTFGRRRYTIDHVLAAGGELEVQCLTEIARLRFRGDLPGWPQWDLTTLALWNPKTHQVAERSGDGSAKGGSGGYRLVKSEFTGRLPDSGQPPEEVEAAWLADAVCLLITAESGGSATVPFDFPSLAFPQ